MANLSTQTMEHWLRDVLGCEERIETIDATIQSFEREKRSILTPRRIEEVGSPDTMPGVTKFFFIGGSVMALLVMALPKARTSNATSLVWGIILLSFACGTIQLFRDRGAEKDHEQASSNRESLVKKEDDRIASIRRTVIPAIDQRIGEFKRLRQSLVSARTRLYATGYLAKEYQGLVPVATMLGYLETRRCTVVDGHGGLIDTFVHDQQFAILNSKLDAIIERLDDIQYTQTVLYRAINETRMETAALRKEIDAAARQLHFDNQNMIECQRYTARTMDYIAGIATYEYLRS